MAIRLPALLCAAALALPLGAAAEPVVYLGTLSGAAEQPAVASPGRGTVRVTVDRDALTMRVQTSFADLLGTTMAAHVHCCTSAPGEGNAGVASMTPSFVGFPSGVRSGSYDRTFDMRDAGNLNPSFVIANGGSAETAFAALVAGLDGGLAYFNVHTSTFTGGELRANLAPVPEPAKAALWAMGLAAIGVLAMRRRAAPL